MTAPYALLALAAVMVLVPLMSRSSPRAASTPRSGAWTPWASTVAVAVALALVATAGAVAGG